MPRLAAVHAFEPLPGTAAVLQANLEAHGVAEKVRVRLVLWCSRQALLLDIWPTAPACAVVDMCSPSSPKD